MPSLKGTRTDSAKRSQLRGRGERPGTVGWLAPVLMRRRKVQSVVLLAIVGLAAATWHGVSVIVETSIDSAGRAAGLVVKEVFLEGRIRAPMAELRDSLGIAVGDAMLSVDPEAMKARLESNAWVAEAHVERRFPDIIHIRIVERPPMALWQHQGRIQVVERNGRVLPGSRAEDYTVLPLLVGAGAPDAWPGLLTIMAKTPNLYSRLSAASWIGERRWTLRFDNRVDVLLPAEGLGEAWRRLVNWQEGARILETELKSIDLRNLDRVLVHAERAGMKAG